MPKRTEAEKKEKSSFKQFIVSPIRFLSSGILIMIALILTIQYLLGPIITKFAEWILEEMEKIFGLEVSAITLSIFIMLTFFAILIWLIYVAIYREVIKKEENSWFYWTIAIGIILLITGTNGINALLGDLGENSVLRHTETGEIKGTLKCTGFTREKVPLDKTNTCEINIDNIASHKTIVQFSGQINETSGYFFNESDEIEFPVPEGTENIQFKIELNTTEGEKYTLATGRDFKEISEDQIERNKERRVVYFLALLGIILFSVPRMMLDLKELAKNK